MADTVSTVKVNIFKNGDHVSGGKPLDLDPTMTLADLCGQVAQIYPPAGTLPYTRVFTDKGREVRFMNAIAPGDLLYFSQGEPFISADDEVLAVATASGKRSPAASSAPASSATAPTAAAPASDASASGTPSASGGDGGAAAGAPAAAGGDGNGGMLRSFATSAASMLASGYTSASTYVKAHASESVAAKLEQFESRFASNSEPHRAKVKAASIEALDWADARMGEAGVRLRRHRDEFLQSEMGAELKRKVEPTVTAVVAGVANAGATAVLFTQDQVGSISAKVKEQAQAAGDRAATFGNTVSARAAEIAEQARVTAEVFYTHARIGYNRARQHNPLSAAEAKGDAAGDAAAPAAPAAPAAGAPAPADAGPSARLGAYLSSVRESLGVLWADRLLPAAHQLYGQFVAEDRRGWGHSASSPSNAEGKADVEGVKSAGAAPSPASASASASASAPAAEGTDPSVAPQAPGGDGPAAPTASERVAAAVSSMAHSAQDHATRAIETIKPHVAQAVETIKPKVQSAVETIKPKVQSAVDTIKPHVNQAVETIKPHVANAISAAQGFVRSECKADDAAPDAAAPAAAPAPAAAADVATGAAPGGVAAASAPATDSAQVVVGSQSSFVGNNA